MEIPEQIRVAVNGYGVIGKRVADAVALQDDMELLGVADIGSDYHLNVAAERGYRLYAAPDDRRNEVEASGLPLQEGWTSCLPPETWW